jgi:hypothetical protein
MADESKKPEMLQDPDLKELRQALQEYIDDLEKRGEDALDEPGGRDERIHEAAIEAFFGKAVWDWINSRPCLENYDEE